MVAALAAPGAEDAYALSATLQVTAAAGIFLKPGVSPPAATPSTLTVSLQDNAFTVESSPLALALQVASQNLLATVFARDLFRDIDLEGCTPVGSCEDIVNGATALAAYFVNPASILDTICPSGQCKLSEAILTDLLGSELHPFVATLPSATFDSAKQSIAQMMASKDLGAQDALTTAVKAVLGGPSAYAGPEIAEQMNTVTFAAGQGLPSAVGL